MTKRILITSGEPVGIGPDVIVQIAQLDWDAELTVVGDPNLLLERAQQLHLPLAIHDQKIGSLNILPVPLNTPVIPGILNIENAAYVINTLKIAADHCLTQKADAVVTGPVHKGILNQAGILFSGHTEFFAEMAHVKQTVMLFVVDQLKVALATTHLPLSAVPKAITCEKLKSVIAILHAELQTKFHIASPRILICGLNPHAGENGYLGREEIEIITPLIQSLRKEYGLRLEGPLPADTIFTPHHLKNADAVLAMYHDQALPLVKYIGFDKAVNVTLGLPFIRTSVDHGTALDIAGTGRANAGSMIKAVKLAMQLIGK